MKFKIKYIILSLLLTCSLFAQSKVATTIGQFLKIEPGARMAAMGNAGVSLAGEASSAFYNPAALGRLSGIDLQFTYNKWLADINYNYASAALNLQGVGTLALQITSLNSGDIEITTVDQERGTGLFYKATNVSLGLAYGIMLTDRVSAGVAANYVQESIYNTSLQAVSFNFGVQYQSPVEGLVVGASVSNFGPRASYNGRDIHFNYDSDPGQHGNPPRLPAELRTDSYGLPTLFRVGLSYPVVFSSWSRLIVAADALHSNDNVERMNVGGEWLFFNTFAVRGGYRDLLMKESEGGLVLGTGARVSFSGESNVSFDYAFADYGRLSNVHRLTVGLHF